MKVVTICGSMRFAGHMQEIARELEATQRLCVIQCVYNPKIRKETLDENNNLTDAHFKKIEICDAIYVMNIGGYIGEATRQEIEYAKKLGKEIIYHEEIKEPKPKKLKKEKVPRTKTLNKTNRKPSKKS